MHIQFGLRAFAVALCASTAVAVLCFPSGAASRSRVQGALFNLAAIVPALTWAIALCVLLAGAFTVLLTGVVASAGAAAGTDGIVFDCPAYLACAAKARAGGPRIAADGVVIGTRWQGMPLPTAADGARIRISTTLDTGSRGIRAVRGAALVGAGGLLFLLTHVLARMTWSGLRRRVVGARGAAML